MPIYKSLPEKKKATDLPFYRPIDRLFILFWEKKKALFPFLIAAVLLAFLYGALRAYRFYSQSRAVGAALASVKSGQKALKEKKYDEAIRWYQGVAENSYSPTLLRITASQNLALACLENGEKDRAIAILEKLVGDPQNVSPEYTRLLLARAYEVKGDRERARELYKTLSSGVTAAGSVEGAIQEMAKERLKWLE